MLWSPGVGVLVYKSCCTVAGHKVPGGHFNNGLLSSMLRESSMASVVVKMQGQYQRLDEWYMYLLINVLKYIYLFHLIHLHQVYSVQ